MSAVNNQENPQNNATEVSLKELILKVKDLLLTVRKNLLYVIIAAIIGAAALGIKAYFTPLIYKADLTFMLNEEGGGGGFGGVLGDLVGIGKGGGGSGFNLDKMVELSKSLKLSSLTLFEKIEVNGDSDYIANHLINLYDYRTDWEDSPLLKDFPGFTHANLDSFSRAENAVLKVVHRNLVNAGGNQLVNLAYDEDTGIMTLNVNTLDENLSARTAEIFYDKLENYYVEKAINKQAETYRVLKSRTDSLERAMNSTQVRLLRFEDRNRSLGLREYEAEKFRLQGELTILQLAFGETYKNLQLAEFNLQNKTPMISAVDSPVLPLDVDKNSIIEGLIFGAIAGALAAVFLIIVFKVYRDIMEK